MAPVKEELDASPAEFAEGVELASARLERSCAKLDPTEEQECAEAGVNDDLAGWPEY